MLCHVIGFTDFDHKGIQGVEGSLDEYLHGQDGYRYIEHNRAGQEIVLYRGQERAARNGYQVHLTIDLNLQNIVENEIDAAMHQYSPKKATIILMRPQTGEILAMANRPAFDLNKRSDAKPEQMKNRAICDMMEPGSTFKIVTAAAAINEHKFGLDSYIFCENGMWNYGGTPLHDHAPFGDLSVKDILVKSSNIGAAKMAVNLGDQKFYEYIRRFGFGDRTGVELPGEISGLIRSPQSWSKISITHIPMGHEIGVTPLQMATAMCAIANGGKLMTPRIVKSINTADGKTISTLNADRFATSHFAANRDANRHRVAWRRERSRHRCGGGCSRIYDCGKNRHRSKSWAARRIRKRQGSRFVLRLSAGRSSGICWIGCAGRCPDKTGTKLRWRRCRSHFFTHRRKGGALSRS